jgi:hypothetical protein
MATQSQRHDTDMDEPILANQENQNRHPKRESSATVMNRNLTANKRIDIVRTEYLIARGTLLRGFLRQRLPDPWCLSDSRHPVRSGNGDIKSDFANLRRLNEASEIKEYKEILKVLYGTSELATKSKTT